MNKDHAASMQVKYPWLEYFLAHAGLSFESVANVEVVLHGDRNLFEVTPRYENVSGPMKYFTSRRFWPVTKAGVGDILLDANVQSKKPNGGGRIISAPPIGQQLVTVYGDLAGLQKVECIVEINGELSDTVPDEIIYTVYVYHVNGVDWSKILVREWKLGEDDVWT